VYLTGTFAATILAHVPKLRFSSKYSDVLRSPQKLKIIWGPQFNGVIK